jgi:type II secretory pathway predicted ATPase ExeA
MYEDFYGLKERPFTLAPDPDYLFPGAQHKLARAFLEYGIRERLGFVVLTGEIGTLLPTVSRVPAKFSSAEMLSPHVIPGPGGDKSLNKDAIMEDAAPALKRWWSKLRVQ